MHRKLVHLLGGIKEVSNNVLNNPQAYDSDAVRRYIAAEKHDSGESLTLDEMTALASYMASQTAKLTPSVGGPDQIAILANGNITKFEQPASPHPPRPLHFALMVGLKLTTAVSFALPADVHFLWIQSKFIAMRFPGLQLDGNFFYGCEVRDSVVSYAGGLTDFGTTNTVDNSWLTWGSAALPRRSNLEEIQMESRIRRTHRLYPSPSGLHEARAKTPCRYVRFQPVVHGGDLTWHQRRFR